MSGGLVGALALFGLVMALATVFVVPTRIEDPVWLGVVVISALVVSRFAPGLHFLHGFLVGLVNWVSVTCTHVVFARAFLARHPAGAVPATLATGPMPPLVAWMHHYQVPIPGASAVIIGLLAWGGSRFLGRKATVGARA